MLIEHASVDHNMFNAEEKTALCLDSQNNHVKVVEILIKQRNVDLNLAELIHGETPLYIASKRGHINITYLLLSKPGIDVNKYTIHHSLEDCNNFDPLVFFLLHLFGQKVRMQYWTFLHNP